MKRRSAGSNKDFSSLCKCLMHEQWSDGNNIAFNIEKSKKFSVAAIAKMRELALLPTFANYLCLTCYQTFKAKNNTEESKRQKIVESQEEKEIDELSTLLRNLITQLKTDKDIYSGRESLWHELLEVIGRRLLSPHVYGDGLAIKSKYKDTEFLVNFDILKYIKERNMLLVRLLCGLSGFDVFSVEKKEIRYAFAVTIEMLYYLRNFNLVLPCSFMSNLVQSCISGSKSVSVVNGKTSPGSGYSTYRKWLEIQGSKQLHCQTGVLDIFIDNIGKYIRKSYRISTHKTPTADVITTAIQIVIDSDSVIQKDANLKPARANLADLPRIHKCMEDEIQKGTESFRYYRYRFISHFFDLFDASHEDIVQRKVQNMKDSLVRTCTNPTCKKVFITMKRKCDQCSSVVTKNLDSHTSVHLATFQSENIDIGQNNQEVRPVVQMAEPVLLNPNSYTNVKQILNEVRVFAEIDVTRKWVFIGCDGPPFCLSERICESDPVQFDFVSMVPGLGHLHMNQLKTIFKILNDIVLEPLGKDVLNFVSPKAYSYFIDAKDTHKSWQALQTFLFGTTMELIHEYRKDESSNMYKQSESEESQTTTATAK